MIAPKKATASAKVTPIRNDQERGLPGLTHFGGMITDEWDRRLRTRQQRMDTVQQMCDDATVAAGLAALDALMRATAYDIEPGVEPDEDAVDLVRTELDAMEDSWESTLSEILTFIPYGYALFEIVYTLRENGTTGWKRWSPRAQDTIIRWDFDSEGREVINAIQNAPPNYRDVAIPLDRCLHVRTRSRRQSPEGKSLIRAAFEPWYAKKHIQRIEGIGIERDMAGMAVAWIPEEAYSDATKRAGWESLVQNVRRDEQAGLVMPMSYDENGNKRYDFNLLSTAGQHQVDTDKVIARYERMILRVLMTDWLTLGDSGGGSFALGVSKSEMFMQFAQGLLDTVADAITSQAVKQLCLLNGYTPDQCPKFTFESISKRDMSKFAAAFQQMVLAGSVDANDPQVRSVVYDELGLPKPDAGFEVQEPVAIPATTPPMPPGVQQAVPAGQAGKAPIGDAQQFTETVSDDLMKRAAEIFRQTVGPDLAGLMDASVINGD